MSSLFYYKRKLVPLAQMCIVGWVLGSIGLMLNYFLYESTVNIYGVIYADISFIVLGICMVVNLIIFPRKCFDYQLTWRE